MCAMHAFAFLNGCLLHAWQCYVMTCRSRWEWKLAAWNDRHCHNALRTCVRPASDLPHQGRNYTAFASLQQSCCPFLIRCPPLQNAASVAYFGNLEATGSTVASGPVTRGVSLSKFQLSSPLGRPSPLAPTSAGNDSGSLSGNRGARSMSGVLSLSSNGQDASAAHAPAFGANRAAAGGTQGHPDGDRRGQAWPP